MNIIYLCVVVAMLFFLLKPDRKEGFIYWVVYAFSLLFLYFLGTTKSCADGWESYSIGKMGACSHHGGVVTNLNLIGYSILIFSVIFLFYKYKKLP